MIDEVQREAACRPQDLEPLLLSRERAGDGDGMAALFEPHSVLDSGDGRLIEGREAIRTFYSGLAIGQTFDFGNQRPAVNSADLALTSTRLPDGSVTAKPLVDKTTEHGCGSSISSRLLSASIWRRVPKESFQNETLAKGEEHRQKAEEQELETTFRFSVEPRRRQVLTKIL